MSLSFDLPLQIFANTRSHVHDPDSGSGAFTGLATGSSAALGALLKHGSSPGDTDREEQTRGLMHHTANTSSGCHREQSPLQRSSSVFSRTSLT